MSTKAMRTFGKDVTNAVSGTKAATTSVARDGFSKVVKKVVNSKKKAVGRVARGESSKTVPKVTLKKAAGSHDGRDAFANFFDDGSDDEMETVAMAPKKVVDEMEIVSKARNKKVVDETEFVTKATKIKLAETGIVAKAPKKKLVGIVAKSSKKKLVSEMEILVKAAKKQLVDEMVIVAQAPKKKLVDVTEFVTKAPKKKLIDEIEIAAKAPMKKLTVTGKRQKRPEFADGSSDEGEPASKSGRPKQQLPRPVKKAHTDYAEHDDLDNFEVPYKMIRTYSKLPGKEYAQVEQMMNAQSCFDNEPLTHGVIEQFLEKEKKKQADKNRAHRRKNTAVKE